MLPKDPSLEVDSTFLWPVIFWWKNTEYVYVYIIYTIFFFPPTPKQEFSEKIKVMIW